MTTQVRRVSADDWSALRTMRLEALQDPAAPIAYLETYDEALARPDAFWQDRAASAATGPVTAQFVAITEQGDWVGSATGLREERGNHDWAGHPISHLQVHVVGVWVHPGHRGAGVLDRLVGAIRGWAGEHGVERYRLLVHEDNARAQAAYRKLGFAPTGALVPLSAGNEIEMALSD
jgi:GNAT superfamily N-acetyltransferase